MRLAYWGLGLALVSMACGESSTGGDLFAPAGSQATSGPTTTGLPMVATSTTSSTTSGAGGSGATGGAGGGTSAGGASGTGGSVATGGSSGAGGDPAGSGGAGASGGTGGNAGAAGSGMSGAGGSGGGGGVGGAAGSGGGADGGVVIDAGVPHPIHCGNTVCAARREFCCIPDGTVPRCVALGGLCSDSADRLYCDDRTDCADAGDICCASDNLSGGSSTAVCISPQQCTSTQRKSQLLCEPTLPGQCGGTGMINACRADNNSTIPGYAYCH